MIRSLLSALAALTMLGAAVPSLAQQAEGPFQYAEDDAAMNAAIAEARRTLPVFWDRASDVDTSRPMLKVTIRADDDANEYLWMGELERDGDRFKGVLVNQPRLIVRLTRGSSVVFSESQIVDWAYEADGRLWGAYTQRVMLDRLDPAAAAQHRAYLSETPLEPKTD